jgi:hypothetical protein
MISLKSRQKEEISMTIRTTSFLCLAFVAQTLLSCQQSDQSSLPNDAQQPALAESVDLEADLVEVEEEFDPTRDDVIGQWRMVATNPSHKNSVTARYMRHSFFDDGTVLVENKDDSHETKHWEFQNGTIVVTSQSGTSKFIEHYAFSNRDKLEKTRFQSIIDGEPFADSDPNDSFIRQGSETEKSMTVWNLFEGISRLNFIDPSTLEVGSSYKLSKQTPIMPSPLPGSLEGMVYVQSGDSIQILDATKVREVVWYHVSSEDKSGWVNSIALFGQDLRK